MKTLIVEDDPYISKLLSRLLSPYGECNTVFNGLEALEAFKKAWEEKEPYDLICMDIMMPGMDGQEALKEIRNFEKELQLEEWDEVKVIMITALKDTPSIVKSYYEGRATAYITKPFDIDDILREIDSLGLNI